MIDPLRFHQKLKSCDSGASCAALFKSLVLPLGFDVFACGALDFSDRDLVIFNIIEWPERWKKFYLESGLVDNDPIVDAIYERQRPFTWSELRNDTKFSSAGRKILQMCKENGWAEGLAVPIMRGGTSFGLVSLAGREFDLSNAERDRLVLISECLMTRLASLRADKRFAVAPIGLTRREIECVSRVARGESDLMIAKALGISFSTAHQHVETARKRLHAKSRAQLIGRCVSFGIIDPV